MKFSVPGSNDQWTNAWKETEMIPKLYKIKTHLWDQSDEGLRSAWFRMRFGVKHSVSWSVVWIKMEELTVITHEKSWTSTSLSINPMDTVH